MHALLIGAGGMLGRDLVGTAPAGISVTPLTHAELDITAYGAVERTVRDARPEVIVNAAGYTAVDRAESEPEVAMRVNGGAVGHLGKVARAVGVRVVHFSTDYVFDGTAGRPYREDDLPKPLNAYGASKLAGEVALQASGAEALIIRTQWLFGATGRSFPRTMWERAVQEEPTRVVNDQTGKPTYTVDLARATWQLVQSRVAGVVHVANSGSATWYELARYVFGLAGGLHLIVPCTSSDYPTAARRPRCSVLSTAKAEGLLEGGLPSWPSAVERFIRSVQQLDR